MGDTDWRDRTREGTSGWLRMCEIGLKRGWGIGTISLDVIVRHSRLPAGNALWFCQIFFFFHRQGFRMITFDRQAGPLQNLNRSQVMVIGRSVSFSDPARPPSGGVGRPKHPKIHPPPQKKIVHAFQNPRNIFEEKKISREKKLWYLSPPLPPIFFWRFKTPGTFLSDIFFSVTKNFSTHTPHPPPPSPPPSPPPPTLPRPALRTLTSVIHVQ